MRVPKYISKVLFLFFDFVILATSVFALTARQVDVTGTISYAALPTDYVYEAIYDESEVVAYRIAGFTSGVHATVADIPSEYHELPVWEIGDYAFEQESIERLTIPSTIKSIGNYAFYLNTSLSAITFESESQLTSIGNGAFSGYNSYFKVPLNQIKIPGNVTSIGANAFSYTTLQTLILSASLSTQTINASAFSNTNLENLFLFNNSKVIIGNDVFSNITNNNTNDEVNVFVPSSLLSTYQADSNWDTASTNLQVDLQNIVENIEDFSYEFIYNGGSIIGAKITGFASGVSLTNVTIPTQCFGYPVIEISEYAFLGKYISSVTIPSSITRIGGYAFNQNANLQTITFMEGSNLQTIGNYAFAGDAFDKTPITQLELPDTLTRIGYGAFSNTTLAELILSRTSNIVILNETGFENILNTNANNKVKVYVPSTLLSAYQADSSWDSAVDNNQIEFNFFDESYVYSAMYTGQTITGLTIIGLSPQNSATSITIPQTANTYPVKEIGDYAFYGENITAVTIEGSNLESIGDYAFAGLSTASRTQITTMELPSSVSSIGNHAFENTTLGDLYIGRESSVVALGGVNVFDGIDNTNTNDLVNVYVSSDLMDDYGQATYWSNIITQKVNVLTQDDNNFAYDNVLNASSEIIGRKVTGFASGINLANVVIPSRNQGLPVLEIADSAFITNTTIQTLYIPKSVEKIGVNSFNNATNLTTITFEADSNLKTISSSAFYYCTKLATMNIQDCTKLETIEGAAFSNNKFVKIILPEGLISIGNYAFENNSSLAAVIFEDGVYKLNIGSGVFTGSSNLKNVYIYRKYFITASGYLTYSGSVRVFVPSFPVTLYDSYYNSTYWRNSYSTVEYFDSNFTYATSGTSAYAVNGLSKEAGKVLSVPSNVGSQNTSMYQVNSISSNAFNGAEIEELNVYGYYVSIGSSAFANSTLSKLILPRTNGIVNISAANVFDGIENENTNNVVYVQVPSSLLSAYQADTYWSLCLSSGKIVFQDLPANDTRFSYSASLSLSNLTYTQNGTYQINSVVTQHVNEVIPKYYNGYPVISINSNVFYGKTTIQTVEISPYVIYIGSGAFSDATNLTSITFDENSNLKEIGTYAFSDAFQSGISNINIPRSLIKINSYAFQNAAAISTLTFDLDSQLIEIGANAFEHASGITSVLLPKRLKTIGNYAFIYATSLNTATIPKEVSLLSGSYIFRYSYLLDLYLLRSKDIVTISYSNIFSNITNTNGNTVRVHIPSSLLSAYQGNATWSSIIGTGSGKVQFITDVGTSLITLDATDGTGSSTGSWTWNSGSGTYTANIEDDSTLGSLPTPTKSGYNFAGWFTEESGGLQIDSSTLVSGANTYYAHWSQVTYYTITLNSQGGSGSSTGIWTWTSGSYSSSIANGSTLGSLPTPSKSGYNFAGWFTSSSGGSQINSSTVVSDTVTYYAQWSSETPQYVTVTLSVEGGTGSATGNWTWNTGAGTYTESILEGSTLGSLPSPTKSGYTFVGWFTLAVNGNQVYSSTVVYSSTTYYAHWNLESQDPDYATITLLAQGGTGSSTGSWTWSSTYYTATIEIGLTLGSLPTPTKDGYEFAGWFTSSSGGSEVDSSTIVSDDASYYAQWNAYVARIGTTYYGSAASAVSAASSGSTIIILTNITSIGTYQKALTIVAESGYNITVGSITISETTVNLGGSGGTLYADSVTVSGRTGTNSTVVLNNKFYTTTGHAITVGSGNVTITENRTSLSISPSSYGYTGQVIYASFTAYGNGNTISSSQYAVTAGEYATNIGSYNLTVTFNATSQYYGTLSGTWSITSSTPPTSSVVITLDASNVAGGNISAGTTNGWTYEGYGVYTRTLGAGASMPTLPLPQSKFGGTWYGWQGVPTTVPSYDSTYYGQWQYALEDVAKDIQDISDIRRLSVESNVDKDMDFAEIVLCSTIKEFDIILPKKQVSF